MLHLAGHCMPSYSFTKLGRDGNVIFNHGPVTVAKGDGLDCVVISADYARALEQYIVSLALAPLIRERGLRPIAGVIGSSRHTGESVTAVDLAVEEWARLDSGWRDIHLDVAVHRVGEEYYGPTAVLHFPGYAYVQTTIGGECNESMALTVYFVFRKHSIEITLIGICAGHRKGGRFDPSSTGPFVSAEALADLFNRERTLSEQDGVKLSCSTAPTEEDCQTNFYKAKEAERKTAMALFGSSRQGGA